MVSRLFNCALRMSFDFRQLQNPLKRTPIPKGAFFFTLRSFLCTDSTNSTDIQQWKVFNGLIPLNEINISYSLSSGPGGQNVNKNHTKVQIKFHVASATWIPESLKPYLIEKESNRITKDGYFVIQSDKTRVQLLNQADCLERIRRMIRERMLEMQKPEASAETIEKHRKWFEIGVFCNPMPDQNQPTPLSPKKEDLSTARLGSVATECNRLKDDYEQCFFEFFPRFLYGEKFKEDPCASQLRTYRQCLDRHLRGHIGIDLDKLETQNKSAVEMAEAMSQRTSRKL